MIKWTINSLVFSNVNYIKIIFVFSALLSCTKKSLINITQSGIPLKPDVPNLDPNDIAFSKINVIDARLDNNFCKNGTFYQNYQRGKNQLQYIVVHYAVSQTIPDLLSTFYERGVSSHYGINQYGKVYLFVPTKFKGSHAGVSAFRDKVNL
ncbi:MAG: N-acetylmuramoyl-L-alanine amidase, partial [Cytophagales bacterium]|nr:N-acetylmuramoyl-L-alanine amidase [Cytophagales bacterium]